MHSSFRISNSSDSLPLNVGTTSIQKLQADKRSEEFKIYVELGLEVTKLSASIDEEEDGDIPKESETLIVELHSFDVEATPLTKEFLIAEEKAEAGEADDSKLCEFPVRTKNNVSVCLNDYKTLEHDTFLNDIIIDFYLTYLFHKVLNEEDRPTVHIFSTMFYKCLNSTPKKASAVASYEKDSSLKPAEKRHLRVKRWTKNVNLFEKNMVIIPICEHSHWYLVIAIRPGLITVSTMEIFITGINVS